MPNLRWLMIENVGIFYKISIFQWKKSKKCFKFKCAVILIQNGITNL